MASPSGVDARLERVTGIIFDIDQTANHDGPGLRMNVDLKGCPLRCLWCHSPESIAPEPQLLWLPTRCIKCGHCARICPQGFDPPVVPAAERPLTCLACLICVQQCPGRALVVKGQRTTAGAIADQAVRLEGFFRRTNGGVTLTGGEPLMQPDFAFAVAALCHTCGIHVAVETSGFAAWQALAPLVPVVSLFLFDVKSADDKRHRESTGQSNKQILDNLRRLAGAGANVVVRLPLIPGYTDAVEDVEEIGRLLKLLGIQRASLLTFNPASAGKYAWLRRQYPLGEVYQQTELHVEKLSAVLRNHGLVVTVEGRTAR